MRNLLLITLLFSLFSGCIEGSSCGYYCDGDVLHLCGAMGSDLSYNCADEGEICVDVGGIVSPGCYLPAENCDLEGNKVCASNKRVECFEHYGDLYGKILEDCDRHGQVCIQLDGMDDPKCASPVYSCDVNIEKVCYLNNIVKCHYHDSQYLFETLEECNKSDEDECIYDPETKSAYCLSDEE